MTKMLKTIFLQMDYSLEYELMNNFCYLIHFDLMTNMFMLTVLVISTTILFFSKEYMLKEEHYNTWFYPCLTLFILSMMLLIMSSSLAMSLIGWEGLGMTSIVLILHYFSKKTVESAFYTFSVTRLGDTMLLISTAYWMTLSLNVEYLKSDILLNFIIFFFFMAIMTKSAMLPFSEWLPKAMVAPTPVSSLVHSSTLVTAGILLLTRYYYIWSSSSISKYILMTTIITLFMSSIAAFMVMDLKKIVAMSTLSQISLIMTTILSGNLKLAFIHLMMHAYTKAMLFMVIGSILHYSKGEQDLRKTYIDYKTNPLLSLILVSAIFSLCGMFFLAGFYSKDMIIEKFITKETSFMFLMMIYTSILLTMIYSFRLLNLLKLTPSSPWSWKYNDSIMLKAMLILASFSISFGAIFMWIIPPLPYNVSLMKDKIILQMILIVGILIGWYWFFNLTSFFSSSWYLSFVSILSMKFYKIFMKKLESIMQMWQYYNSYSWKTFKLWALNSHKLVLMNSNMTFKMTLLILIL
uniref:NADH dehydrogenase subunit 5 n=1 Tax=Laemobothrion maximum TaxID=2337902 RepID=UPI00257A1EA5|nr:NADH dehydrogenase subunit 5 [Laemobothrion maximum]WGU50346.1 NADH dehydrogenase subunit 5 [Laemobothrion maximum]